MRRFAGCQFGPFALRRLLRGKFLPDERLVGWGPGSKKPDPSAQMWVVAMHLAPGVGHGIGAMMQAQWRRWIVLTDHRLLVLGLDRGAVHPSERGVKAQVMLGDLDIAHIPAGSPRKSKDGSPRREMNQPANVDRFVLSWLELGRTEIVIVDVHPKANSPHRKLGLALATLATSAWAPEEVSEG